MDSLPTLSEGQGVTQGHTSAPVGTFATPDARFDQVHLDIVGPLPPSR